MVYFGGEVSIHHQVKISSDRGVLGEVFKAEGFTRVRLRQAGTWAGGQEEDWALSQTGALRGATAARVPLRALCVGGASTPARSESLLFGFLFVVILGYQETRDSKSTQGGKTTPHDVCVWASPAARRAPVLELITWRDPFTSSLLLCWRSQRWAVYHVNSEDWKTVLRKDAEQQLLRVQPGRCGQCQFAREGERQRGVRGAPDHAAEVDFTFLNKN